MNVVKKKLKEGRFGAILISIFVILIGFFIIFSNNTDVIDFLTAKTFIFDLPVEEIKSETYYVVDNNILFDYYATDNEGTYYFTVMSDRNNNDVYLGYYVYSKDFNKAEEVCDGTWELINNGKSTSAILKGHGYVYDMGEKEKEFFLDMMKDYEIEESECLFKTITLVPYSKIVTSKLTISIIIGLFMMVVGLIMLVSMLSGKTIKSFYDSKEKYHISDEKLDRDVEDAFIDKTAIVGKNYLVGTTGTPFVVPQDKIVWIYKGIVETKHKLYGIIPMGTTKTYEVCVVEADKELRKIPTKNESVCDNLIAEIKRVNPYCYYDYKEEIVDFYNSNFPGMVESVSEKRFGYENIE